MNNIYNSCIQKSKATMRANPKNPDYGCGCFVETISQNTAFEDLRTARAHTKYLDYLIKNANKTCSSNYK